MTRFIDWIWHVRGSLALSPGQSSDDAFGRLDPLFQQTGTTHEWTGDTLTFRKKDSAAQDKMSIFDGGVLRIEHGVLHYSLTSRALLFCFLAPLLFLAFAAGNIALNKLEKPATEEKAKKDGKDKKKDEAVKPLHWIDQALGAPAPEKPKKDKDAKDGKDKKDEGEHSPITAYVFAGLFAVLYLVGRILEAKLVKRLFRRKLEDAQPA